MLEENTVEVTEALNPDSIYVGSPPPAKSLAFDVRKTFSNVPGTLTAGFTGQRGCTFELHLEGRETGGAVRATL